MAPYSGVSHPSGSNIGPWDRQERTDGLERALADVDPARLPRHGHRQHYVQLENKRALQGGGAMTWANDPASFTLFSPDQVRSYNQSPQTPPQLRIPLPVEFNSLNDILQLPLQSMTVGFGDPRTRQENGSLVRTWDNPRLYFQDTWRARESLTLNYGLAWMMDGYKNYDLSKPEYLAPVLGHDGLGPTRRQWKNFSPSLGLAWTPSRDKQTVIHAGAGIYYDFFFQNQIDTERATLGRPGTGRQAISGAGIANPLTGIPGFEAGTPLNITGSRPRCSRARTRSRSCRPSVRAWSRVSRMAVRRCGQSKSPSRCPVSSFQPTFPVGPRNMWTRVFNVN